ncbi:MAG: hypothetical protein ABIR62_04780 [Dokdonella sp.]|uniref:hypothetical protein n=1 Tax=Dokdonella sp. TaxID=2291710 RepID=UPI003264096C
MTRFENIWGHATNVDAAVLWPGTDGAVPAIMNWGKTQYVAAKFTVPAGVNPNLFNVLGYSTYFGEPLMTMSVSETCGDFSPPNPSLCLTSNVATGGGFKKMVIVPKTNGCPLIPGRSYFINLKMSDPTPAQCANQSICTISTNNGHN